MPPVDYNRIAPHYDARYAVDRLPGVAAVLRRVAQAVGAKRALEAGCGTGRWLSELAPQVPHVTGLDLSAGMLARARRLPGPSALVLGQAVSLPFAAAAFDLVYCVNALHHFPDPARFVAEARRVLRPGGALAIVGMDPHAGRDRWYIYDYFEGTLDADRARFPSAGTLLNWLVEAGFERAEWGTAQRLGRPQAGRAVLDDPLLQKHGTSQLALLTDDAYHAGLRRLHAALAAAESHGETPIFDSDITLYATVAFLAP